MAVQKLSPLTVITPALYLTLGYLSLAYFKVAYGLFTKLVDLHLYVVACRLTDCQTSTRALSSAAV